MEWGINQKSKHTDCLSIALSVLQSLTPESAILSEITILIYTEKKENPYRLNVFTHSKTQLYFKTIAGDFQPMKFPLYQNNIIIS